MTPPPGFQVVSMTTGELTGVLEALVEEHRRRGSNNNNAGNPEVDPAAAAAPGAEEVAGPQPGLEAAVTGRARDGLRVSDVDPPTAAVAAVVGTVRPPQEEESELRTLFRRRRHRRRSRTSSSSSDSSSENGRDAAMRRVEQLRTNVPHFTGMVGLVEYYRVRENLRLFLEDRATDAERRIAAVVLAQVDPAFRVPPPRGD